MALDKILTALGGSTSVTPSGWYSCVCPTHEDNSPSLALQEDKSAPYGVNIICHVCKSDKPFKWLKERGLIHKIKKEALPKVETAAYRYTDENGKLVFTVKKYTDTEGGKTFRQFDSQGKSGLPKSLKGGKLKPIYNLPAVIKAKTVYLVEGEKDADTLKYLGFTATTNAGGAGKWQEASLKWLVGKKVVILPDQDTVGQAHMHSIALALTKLGQTAYTVDLSPLEDKEDVTNYFEKYGEPALRNKLGLHVKIEPKVYASLSRSKDGALPKSIFNTLTVLREGPYEGKFKLDTASNRVVWSSTNKEVTEIEAVQIAATICNKCNYPSFLPKDFWEGVPSAIPSYDSIETWANTQIPVWDGVPRLKNLFTEYFISSKHSPLQEAYGKKWFVSMLARMLHDQSKVDTVLHLWGPQGIGKSQAMRILAPCEDLLEENLSKVGDKDDCMRIVGKVLVVLEEAQAIKKADADMLKAFISQLVDTFRAPYARKPYTHKRRCVFVMLSNRQLLLKSGGGTRRYWSVNITKVDLVKLKRDKLQLYAEAKFLLNEGYKWWFEAGEFENELKEASESVEDHDNLVEDFFAFLKGQFNNKNQFVTRLESLKEVNAKEFLLVMGLNWRSADRRQFMFARNSLTAQLNIRGWVYTPRGVYSTDRKSRSAGWKLI